MCFSKPAGTRFALELYVLNAFFKIIIFNF